MSFSVVDATHAQDITCAICLEPWDDPVEIQPCRHVFCKKCCAQVQKCPDCRGEIKGRSVPNRILVNMSKEIEMKCDTCGWTGARETCNNHRCSTAAPQRPPPQNYAPQPVPQRPPPQPQQQAYQPYSAPPPSRPPPPPQPSAAPWAKFNLSQEEYDHIFAVFLTFDTDGSGALDRDELTTLCRWLNFAHTPQDVTRMFYEMDTDRSGTLDLEEFCSWLSTHRPDPQALYGMSPIEYQNVLFQFHSYDGDQNGYLDQNEFAGLCMRQGYCQSRQEAMDLFHRVDADRSGYVDLHELLSYRAAMRRGPAPSHHYHHHHHHQQHQYPPQQQPTPYPHHHHQQHQQPPPNNYARPPSGPDRRTVDPHAPAPQGYENRPYPPPNPPPKQQKKDDCVVQ